MGEILVGREGELARLNSLLGAAEAGDGGAIRVVGPPGIGKTALLAEVRRSHQHLRSILLTGVEVEAGLAFAGLSTLLTALGDDAERLSGEAMGLLRGAIGANETRPVGLQAHQGLLELLGELTAHEPLLVVVDDAQWIDTDSLGLLGFVARRIGNDRLALICASRDSDQVDAALRGIETLRLAALSRSEARELLADSGVDPVVAAACWSATEGVPLAMAELVDVLSPDQRTSRAPLPDPLPAAGSIRRNLAAQLVEVAEASRTAVAVLAVEGTGGAGVVARALHHLGIPPAALDDAVESGLLHRTPAGFGWRHPLARSAVLVELSPADLRRAHEAVAVALDQQDSGRVAHHLAAAAAGPDEALADRLEEVARDAAERGASAAASQAWAASAQLSMDDESRFNRSLESVTAHWRLGDSAGTLVAAEELRRQTTDPVRRARCGLIVGQASTWWQGPMIGARRLREEAALVADTDPASAAMLSAFASNSAMMGLVPASIVADALATRTWAAEAEDLGLAVMADAMECFGHLLGGNATRGRELLAPLPELTRFVIDSRIAGGDAVAQVVCTSLMAVEEFGDAEALLTELVAWCRATGNLGMEAYATDQLTDLAWRRGDWEGIGTSVGRMHALAEGAEQPVSHQFRLRQARLDAVRGRFDDADAVAERALDVAQEHGFGSIVLWAREALALSRLGRGEQVAALRHLDALAALYDEREVHAPAIVWWQAMYVELLVAVGRTQDARRARDRLAADHQLFPGHWSQAALSRADAALAPDGEAVVLLSRAIDELRALGAPFELGLTRLTRATRLVAAGCAEEAREELLAALDRFDRLGAKPWSDRAFAMLDRPADVPRSQPLSAQLSDAELRVARAVGAGMSNREVAAELFLSTHTVNSHLRSIYSKLQINSRSKLAMLLARSPSD